MTTEKERKDALRWERGSLFAERHLFSSPAFYSPAFYSPFSLVYVPEEKTGFATVALSYEKISRELLRRKMLHYIKKYDAIGYHFRAKAQIKYPGTPNVEYGFFDNDPDAKDGIVVVFQHMHINDGETRVWTHLFEYNSKEIVPDLNDWNFSAFPKGSPAGFFGDLLSKKHQVL